MATHDRFLWRGPLAQIFTRRDFVRVVAGATVAVGCASSQSSEGGSGEDGGGGPDGGLLPRDAGLDARMDASAEASVEAGVDATPIEAGPIGTIITINKNTPYDANPCPAENGGGQCIWTGGAGFSTIFEQYSGGLYCPGDDSLVMWSGGEHYWGPGIKFTFATGLWSVASDLPTDITGTDVSEDPDFDVQWGTFGDGVPPAPHTYDCLCYLPPDWGGGANGSLVVPTRNVYFQVSSTKYSMKCDLATKHWSHASSNASAIQNTGGGHSWVADPPNRRYLGIPGGSSQYTADRIYTLSFPDTSGLGTHGSGPAFAEVALPRLPCQALGANRTVLIAGGSPVNNLLLMAYDADALDTIYALTCTLPGYVYGSSIGLAYVPDTGEFWALPAVSSTYTGDEAAEAKKPLEALYRIIPPSNPNKRFTDPWTVVKVPVSGAWGYNPSGVYKRFMFYPPTKSLVWCANLRGPVYSLRVA
jgi:hypothetical protein